MLHNCNKGLQWTSVNKAWHSGNISLRYLPENTNRGKGKNIQLSGILLIRTKYIVYEKYGEFQA